MMRWIVESSLRCRFLVVAIAAVVMFMGFNALRIAPMDVLPEFSPPVVEVQTEALGLSAAEVEQLITVPLEADLLNGVAWLKTIESESVPGLSSITLLFEPGTDIMRARQVVQERLTQAHALPNVSKPPVMRQPVSSANRVTTVGLSSTELSPIQVSVLARWTVKPRLMGVPGVANVSIWGQRKRQLQVQVDPEQLQAAGVTLNQVISTTGDALWVSPLSFLNASLPGTGGFIDTPNQRLGVRHVLPITSPEELARVVVDGETLLLGDVAEVVENHQPLIGDAVVDDGPGLLLVVEKFPWANTVEVTEGVEDALAVMAPGLSGVEVETELFRPATFIETGTRNLTVAAGVGLLLLGLVLGVFQYDWRRLVMSIVAILLSLATAILVLYLRGITLNAMIAAGCVVALGVVIDDAVVGAHNIARRWRDRQQGSAQPLGSWLLEAVLETRGAVLAATVVLLLAVLPVVALEGAAGALFSPLASGLVLAVLASMAVALVVTPVLATFLFTEATPDGNESPVLVWLRHGYDRLLSRAMPAPAAAMLAAVVLVVMGMAVFPRVIPDSLSPTFKEYDVVIRWDGAPGTSRPEMARITNQAGRELRTIPGVGNVGAHVGRAVMSDEVVNVNAAELWVRVDPSADYTATLTAIQEVVDGYPGLSREVSTYSTERLGDALTGTADDLVVRVYGHDIGVLREEAEKVRDLLSGIDGVVDPQVAHPNEEPVVEIEVDLAAAERHGIKPGDVRRASATLLSGLEVGMLADEQKVFDVVVWGTPETRHSLTSIRELLLDTPRGGHVRLEDVAHVAVGPATNVIRREGVAQRIDVSATVGTRDQPAVSRDIERRLQAMAFPLEYHAELLGGSAERRVAAQRLAGFAAAALIGMFFVLQAACRSWRLAAVVFLSLPLALAGGVITVWLTGGALSLGPAVGLLTILGIAARSSLGLIHHAQRLEQRDGEVFGPELVLRAARERFAPTGVTIAATGVVLLPLAWLGEIAGLEIAHGIAVVVLGGLVSTALLNLYVVPALYLRFGRGSAREWSLETGPQADLSGAQYAS